MTTTLSIKLVRISRTWDVIVTTDNQTVALKGERTPSAALDAALDLLKMPKEQR